MSENTKNAPGKKAWILLAVAAVLGACLLLWGSLAGGQKKSNSEEKQEQEGAPDVQSYALDCETQIRQLCTAVTGSDSVKVTVTLKGGYRTLYATDSQAASSGGYKSEMVLVGSGSAQKAVAVGYENPEIAGVGIVCCGGEDPATAQKLISLVSAAFHISSNKIFVCGLPVGS